MQKFSYHTHSTFSDGQNTASEMIEHAAAIGLDEFGISDHLIVHKNIEQLRFCGAAKKIFHSSFDNELVDLCNKHADEIRKASKKYGIKTRVGYEADYFTYNGWIEEFDDFLKKIDYDYLISGNHYFMSSNGEDIFDIWCFQKYKDIAPEDTTVYLKRHFQTLSKAVASKRFWFLAHPDYAQTVYGYNESDYQTEFYNTVQALLSTKTGCEISTKGLRKFGHFYPSKNILSQLIEKNIPIIVSDDAHEANQICSFFDDAENELAQLGCKNRLIFAEK